MSKPLELKSPDNALGLGLYAGIAVLATAFLLSPTVTKAMDAFLGSSLGVSIWAWFLLVASATGLVSATIAPRLSRPKRALGAEAVAAPIMGLLLELYVVALTRVPTFPTITFLIFLLVGFAGIARGIQLTRELYVLQAAQRASATAIQESLADPRSDT